jgi:hypothetical protein
LQIPFEGIHDLVQEIRVKMKRFPGILPPRGYAIHLLDQGQRASVFFDGDRGTVELVSRDPGTPVVSHIELPWSEVSRIRGNPMRVVWLWFIGDLKTTNREEAIAFGRALEDLRMAE